MKKSIIMAAMLLLAPCTGMADDAAWGEVGGGSLDQPATKAAAKPAVQPAAATCGQDDPRMQNLIVVLKDIKAGKKVEPLQMSFGTFMGLSGKIRKMLGDNIVIVTANCKKQFIFDGELTGKVEMPFPEAMTYINQALRARDIAQLKFIFSNVKAAPDTLHNILNYSVARTFPLETGKVLVQTANIKPVGSNKESMGVLLLNLYQALGGRIKSGEKNKVNIYKGQAYIAYLVYADDGFTVTVGSGVTYLYSGNGITDMGPTQLAEAYASLGLSSIVTINPPSK